jgi:N-acetylglucosamine kinase-like BadF-type ATPase
VSRPAFLAVDAGGSKIDAALVRRDGTLLGATRIRGGSHDGTGGEAHLELVVAAAEAARRTARLGDGHLPVADLGVYCQAGADLPTDERRIRRWLRHRGLTADEIVRNDTFAVLRAGTDRTWGVAVVCGYGTNCSGVAPDGRRFRLPALGEISGDWGGGADIGRAALWHAVRAEDGRGDPTELRRLVPDHFGLRRPRQVVERIYGGGIDALRLVELAPVVFSTAASGDPVSRAIVDRQADEVVAMAGAAIRRLRLRNLDPEVVLGGSVFRARDPRFFGRIEQGIVSIAPAARVSILAAPPVLGAVLLGMDRVGARPSAYRRIRAALTERRLSADTRPLRKG